MSIEDDLKGKKTYEAWKKVGIRHHHGINVPLFSIHTEKSCGIGEFFDLIPLIDWCAQLGFDVIQLLPINDCGKDSSPYNAISSCALHPIYLSLHALPFIDGFKSKILAMKEFNGSKRLHYQIVNRKKLFFLRSYFQRVKDLLRKEPSYESFVSTHDWLHPYALFRVLKYKFDFDHWQDWPSEFKGPSASFLKKLYVEHANEIEFYIMLQYLCFKQLKEVKAYAESKGVFLKGDIPILVSPDSVDVWLNPSFFDFSYVAGSPPNEFDAKGQYWGFPLYEWKTLEQNNYEWWKKRLLTARELYHIYRIDHIIGFFRIWAIPPYQKPQAGLYLPKDPAIMEAQGSKILGELANVTTMLPIGEDLGHPPSFLPRALHSYGIPGTKLFRWQKEWETTKQFIPCKDFPPVSMSSVSTHDIDTVKLWWKKKPHEAKAYAAFRGWKETPNLSEEQLFEILYDNHHSGSLFHINLLQEYLALAPELTWEDPEDERINYPGTVSPRNWSYRYKLPLEEITQHAPLNEQMKRLAKGGA